MTAPLSKDTPIDCFSTLGCPDASPEEVCALARQSGTRQIELRCLDGQTDYPRHLDEHPQALESFLAELRRHSLAVAVVDSSYSLGADSTTKVEELLAACRVADRLAVPYVRVFGGGVEGTLAAPEEIDVAARRYDKAVAACGRENLRCRLLVETHMGFVQAEILEAFCQRVETPVEILWDTHHTWKRGRESPSVTYARLKARIRHIHCKDSRVLPGGRTLYVPPGEGEYPFAEFFTAVGTSSQRPPLSLEWEQRWHPEIGPLKPALAGWQTVLNRFSSA